MIILDVDLREPQHVDPAQRLDAPCRRCVAVAEPHPAAVQFERGTVADPVQVATDVVAHLEFGRRSVTLEPKLLARVAHLDDRATGCRHNPTWCVPQPHQARPDVGGSCIVG